MARYRPPTVKLDMLWKATSGDAGDGWPAVADLDGNGTPEVVLVAYPEIKVLDGNTGNLWCGVDPTGTECTIMPSKLTQPVDLPGASVGGPVAIADFDGDGRLEFGLSIGTRFVLYDLFRTDEDVVTPPMDPFPKAGSIFRRWTMPVRDISSASVGASAFDFDGDGAAEVLFQDECFSRVYDGETGAVRVEIMNSSATIHEYPVVADVDGDGRSELVVVANLSDEVLNEGCPPGHVPRKGVYVYRNAEDRWAPTRRVWTEHSHHVTNAEAAGIVPVQEASHWTVPGRNNFRQGPHGPVLTNAPDLAASLAIDVTGCPQTIVLRATIFNKGSLGVPAGIDVAFYAGPEPGQAIGAGTTEVPLGPGGFTFVEVAIDAPAGPESYRVVVDAGDAIAECDEDNNHAEVIGAACP
jgi:hypothetical protein